MSTPLKPEKQVSQLISHLFRQEYGKIVAYLTSLFGLHQLQSMEDITQETLLDAYRNWSYRGIPEAPDKWLFKVAKNKAINFYKREKRRAEIHDHVAHNLLTIRESEVYLSEEVSDSMLRMMFACMSPKFSDINKILLVLNTLCGFNRKEIAQALLMEEEAVKKRLFRAKRDIREQSISLAVPVGDELEHRLQGVLSCLYLLFNEGYNSSNADELIRKDICLEAIRLCKLLVIQFEEETTSKALLSLMCFHAARFQSRIDDKGAIILIGNQDRKKWDQELIALGTYYLSKASHGDDLSSFHLEAAIAAEHCKARSFEETDWQLILRYYHHLSHLKPSPVIALNIALVTSQLGEVAEAVSQLKVLAEAHKSLKNYYLLHASLGELYIRLDEKDLALASLLKARDLTKSIKEITLLEEKIQSIHPIISG
ncbi:MAG: sigma-70 family RNA polymerase sigma factor [Cyclobacteriaceae bacterium]|nr:sigma-70 family RNA polymerase sigma factor [Cyclobacteriaceae bacterium HetDA_MAG_MS6]